MDTSSPRKSTFPAIALIVICLLWAGMLLGISFLETPVKFQAPTVTVAVALDVGRTVFHYFTIVQLVLLALMALSVFFARPPRILWIIAAIVAVCLILQAIWLLPVLDARVSLVQANLPLPKTPVHSLYGLTEILKLAGLMWMSIGTIKKV